MSFRGHAIPDLSSARQRRGRGRRKDRLPAQKKLRNVQKGISERMCS